MNWSTSLKSTVPRFVSTQASGAGSILVSFKVAINRKRARQLGARMKNGILGLGYKESGVSRLGKSDGGHLRRSKPGATSQLGELYPNSTPCQRSIISPPPIAIEISSRISSSVVGGVGGRRFFLPSAALLYGSPPFSIHSCSNMMPPEPNRSTLWD